MSPSLHLSFCAFKTTTLASELLVSMGPSPHLWFLTCKTATLGPELQVFMGPRPHLSFFAFKTATLAPELQVSMGPSPHLWFCAFTTATLWPELIVSMGPRPHLSVLCMQNSVISTRITLVSIGPRPHLSFCAFKTTWLASELLVSMGPSPHCGFCKQNSDFRIRITESLWVPDLLWMPMGFFIGPSIQNCDFSIRIASLYGSQPSSVVLCKFTTATLWPELIVSMGPRLRLLICECKTACLDPIANDAS